MNVHAANPNSKVPRTVADGLIARFAADGIDTVFGLTGGGIMYLVDALARSSEVDLIAVHHEEYAGVAADGYARTGRPYGVALATTGPGAAQLFAAVTAAWQDSSPVVFIVGQVKTADSSSVQGLDLRQNGTFEFDTTKAFAPVTKLVEVISNSATAEEQWNRAIAVAQSGRPGPVLLEIPLDIQGAPWTPAGSSPEPSSPRPAPEGLAHGLSQRLLEATRPLVLIGGGVVRAGVADELTAGLTAAGVPYIVTQFAREAGSLEHPLYLGSPGIKANRSANAALMQADLLVAIGTSLHQQVIGWEAEHFQNSPSWKLWFELDAKVIAARKHLVDEAHELSCASATAAILEALSSARLAQAAWGPWQLACRSLRQRQLLHFPAHAPVEGRMDLYRAISTLSEHAESFAAAVTDAGIVWYAMAQHYFPAPRSAYISSGSYGAMGMALPMAIGAAAATKQPVLSVTGDGSLMMCLSELATLTATRLPVLLIINSNNGYLSIRSTQDRFFDGRRLGTDGSNGVFIPTIGKIAELFELPYWHAADQEQLQSALESALATLHRGPVIIEVATYEDQAVEPMVASRQRPDGAFTSASLADMQPPLGDAHDL